MEGNIHTGFGGTVALFHPIHIGQDIVQHKRVLELSQVHLIQETDHRLLGFPQVGWHGGFPVTGQTLVFDPAEHHRGGVPGVSGHGKGMF